MAKGRDLKRKKIDAVRLIRDIHVDEKRGREKKKNRWFRCMMESGTILAVVSEEYMGDQVEWILRSIIVGSEKSEEKVKSKKITSTLCPSPKKNKNQPLMSIYTFTTCLKAQTQNESFFFSFSFNVLC